MYFALVNIKYKYSLIGSAANFAVTDFNGSITKASKLADAKFSNGLPAKVWLFGFDRKRDAELFANRCREALAFQSGRIGRWITPTFCVVKN